uniref:Uncharacterized protein n=1 Tax=Anopheles farauti TaxID=69004 RepID=A0A182QWI4_9DIPT
MRSARLGTGSCVALLLSLALTVATTYFRAILSSGSVLLSFTMLLALLATIVGRDGHNAQDHDQEEQSSLRCCWFGFVLGPIYD